MSGSGGGSGGTDFTPTENCETISFNTDINSPQIRELDGLNIQDVLNVALDNNTVVVKRPDTGKIIGSINWSSIARLIECIHQGHTFLATIRDIQDGLIKVNISSN